MKLLLSKLMLQSLLDEISLLTSPSGRTERSFSVVLGLGSLLVRFLFYFFFFFLFTDRILLDVAFYGLGLNSSIILQAIGYGPGGGTGGFKRWQTLQNVSVGNVILSCAGLIPGYW